MKNIKINGILALLCIPPISWPILICVALLNGFKINVQKEV
nr:MAG TPA: protein of unknown function (DUF4342) [Caudoviricetes sp.]